MTTYKTGNPLGSVSPKDLFDNSENLDHAVNGVALIWKDRSIEAGSAGLALKIALESI